MNNEPIDLKKYVYVEEFGGKFEMVIYNIDYDRMFRLPAVCPGGSKEEDIDVNFVYYMLENGSWKIKVKGQRNREGASEKWKFFIEMQEEDAAAAWEKRMEILPKGYVKKRQYPDEFLETMTRESGVIMSGEEERRTRFNEYMEDELQLPGIGRIGEIQPGGEEVPEPDSDYLPTTPEEEVTAEGGVQSQQAVQVQQVQQRGEEGQRDGEGEMDVEEYPPPSDAADSDCRGPYGDSHIPGVYETGGMTREDEMDIMYGNREQREALLREADEIERRGREAQQEIDEMIRLREQARGSEDVSMENQELLEASTTPTSLEEAHFYSNMVDELRDGVDPFSRIVIEASMEASNLALSTNGDDLEVMMRIIRDTAMEAHRDERTPRQRLRILRRRFRARLEGCGIWQRSLTQAEMRERSRSRTSRATRTTTRRSPTAVEGPEEEEPEAEEIESEGGETESQQYRRYMQSGLDEVSDPELWQQLHH